MNTTTEPKAEQRLQKLPKKRRSVLIAVAACMFVAVILTACQKTGPAQTVAGAAASAPASVSQPAESAKSAAGGNGEGVTIVKKDVTEKASFIPYQIGDTKMEIVAVKASDGTIRTALNTCQVCWDSGRGYYKQEGDELVCQNCGNRFKIDQVEKVKDGCNPVPIPEEYKKDNGDTITITGDALAKYKGFFQQK